MSPLRVEDLKEFPRLARSILAPMPQSLARLLVHTVFSTKERRPFLRDPALRQESHRYLGGILKNLGCQPIIVGGIEDHVHLLARASQPWAEWYNPFGIGLGFGSGDVRDINAPTGFVTHSNSDGILLAFLASYSNGRMTAAGQHEDGLG